MNLRSYVSIEIPKEDNKRLYQLLIPNYSPYAEVKEVLAEMLDSVNQMEAQDKERAAAAQSPSEVVQEEKPLDVEVINQD